MSNLLQSAVNGLCNCGYLLPSNGHIDPEVHKSDCVWRRFIVMATDEQAMPDNIKLLLDVYGAICYSRYFHQAAKRLVAQYEQETNQHE